MTGQQHASDDGVGPFKTAAPSFRGAHRLEVVSNIRCAGSGEDIRVGRRTVGRLWAKGPKLRGMDCGGRKKWHCSHYERCRFY